MAEIEDVTVDETAPATGRANRADGARVQASVTDFGYLATVEIASGHKGEGGAFPLEQMRELREVLQGDIGFRMTISGSDNWDPEKVGVLEVLSAGGVDLMVAYDCIDSDQGGHVFVNRRKFAYAVGKAVRYMERMKKAGVRGPDEDEDQDQE